MSNVSHDSETPAHGQQVLTACAFIYHDFDGIKKVFLARRAAIKKFYPNVYELPGGHIDFGEDMKAGLRREIKEELQMDTIVGDPFFVFTYLNNVKGSHSIEVVYFAKFIQPIEEVIIDNDDHAEYGWFAEKNVEDTMKIGRKATDRAETEAVLKGFKLLRGGSLDFAD